MTPERVAWHVWNWAQWMREDDHGLGYPKHAPGFSTTTPRDFDGLLAQADIVCATAVDAIVQGMAPAYRLALYLRHGLCAAVYRCGGDPEANHAEALRQLGVGLDRKGLT